MNEPTQLQKAQDFIARHAGPRMLVLPNAWDVVSARVIEEAGFPAIATSSAGVAWALGFPDGERISRGEMLAVVRRIATSVRIPVSADVEGGYGATPEAAAETARGVIAAGAIGLNLEDGTNEGLLLDLSLQVARIRAVREAGGAARVPLVINARTDAFEVKQWSPAERFAAAVRRANAYRAAGARDHGSAQRHRPPAGPAAGRARAPRRAPGEPGAARRAGHPRTHPPYSRGATRPRQLRRDGRPGDSVRGRPAPGGATLLTAPGSRVYLC